MAMSGFICHDDYLQKTAKLTNAEVGRLFRALMRYHATGVADEIDGRESIAFDFIREDIDRTEAAYKVKCEKNRNNRLSALNNDRQQPSTNVNECVQKEKEKEKEEDKDNDKERGKKARFSPPTLDEAREYCRKIGCPAETADRFVDYYTSNGWMVGRGPMKDWRAAMRNWARGDMARAAPVRLVSAQTYQQRDYSDEDAEAMRRMMQLPVV